MSLFLCRLGKTSSRASILVLMFFSYSGPSGILYSDKKHNTAYQ